MTRTGRSLPATHRVKLCGIATLLLALACSGEQPALSYADRIVSDRAAKDRFFREDPSSPIPAAERSAFPPLRYFAPDESYRVPASLRVSTENAGQVIKIPTSTGLVREMVRIGALEFSLKGQPLTLTAFAEVGDRQMNRLFVPFSDLTTGTETYAGGRYLDLDRTATGLYLIDFNRAYHPYCVYNPVYDCPYPPRENRLPIPVRAGERLPSEETGGAAPGQTHEAPGSRHRSSIDQ